MCSQSCIFIVTSVTSQWRGVVSISTHVVAVVASSLADTRLLSNNDSSEVEREGGQCTSSPS